MLGLSLSHIETADKSSVENDYKALNAYFGNSSW